MLIPLGAWAWSTIVLGVLIPLGAWIWPTIVPGVLIPLSGETCATAGLPTLRHKHARTAPRAIFIGV